MNTLHQQMERGQTYAFRRQSRDELNRTRNLTGAKIYMSVRADMKIAPSIKLTSETPAPVGWRTGITIDDQAQYPGWFTVTLIPDDTKDLVALGHDDPWLYDVRILLGEKTITALTVTVDAIAGTFTRSAGSFIVDGFAVQDDVSWAGFSNAGNNVARRRITGLSALVMTFTDLSGLVNEVGNGNEEITLAGSVVQEISTSNLDIYPQITDLP